VLAVAAVAGLAAALALRAGPDAPVAPQGRAPSTLAGIAVCLPPFDVSAYRTADGRVVFPINHPDWNHSLDLRPARCFSSERQAQQAGYRIAPPPPGFRVVEGIYLVLAPQDLSAGCRGAGRKLSFRPRCPALVPAGAAWTCGPCLDDRAFVLSGTANAPADYVGVEGGGLHLVVAASRDPRSTRLTCAGMRPAGNLSFRGGRARLVPCPRGSELHSGLLARWTAGGVSYAVSLHGSDRRNRHLLGAFLDALRK
jgi:hypothetical protein